MRGRRKEDKGRRRTGGRGLFIFGRDFIQEWRKGDFGETLGESELIVVTVGIYRAHRG